MAGPEAIPAGEEHDRQRGEARVNREWPRVDVDFARPVFCIAGLPVDAVDMGEAVRRVREAAFSGKRCVVTTPNLNFVTLAQADPAFRESVCGSDLVLADGMPLVWIARLLGVPLPGRVPGAGLFDALCAHEGAPVTVYFYGGPPGAAAAACASLERHGGGLRCVGHETPAFATVQDLSQRETIDRINESGAQFVIVSLGAVKGQAWIEHNRSRLAAPVLCHLGAVINFAAGTIRRAPPAWQGAGAEWLWRIKEEPALWRRYWRDGRSFAALMASRVLPCAIHQRKRALLGRSGARPQLNVERSPDRVTLRLAGDWSAATLGPMRLALREALALSCPASIELGDVTSADSAFVALLQLAHAAWGGRLEILHPSQQLVRLMHLLSADFLLEA